MLGVLLLGFGGAWMTGACVGEIGPLSSSASSASVCPALPAAPATPGPTTCPAPIEDPCWRYHIQLVGDLMNTALRAKYIAVFGDACYVSEANTFDCWYKTWQDACVDAVKIGEVSGNAPYDRGYECQPDGVGNYWLQIGPDVANRTWIFFDKAPRQTPLVEVDGVDVEVNGPYRNLPEPPTVGLAQPFNKCSSGVLGPDGKPITQTKYILQVNRNAHGGEIHSDLAGFTWPCKRMDENCKEVEEVCEEPLVLADPDKPAPFHPGLIARVHHVVPMKDKRSCDWGTNSNKNAAVISHELNEYFKNGDPPEDEVRRLNNAPAYTP